MTDSQISAELSAALSDDADSQAVTWDQYLLSSVDLMIRDPIMSLGISPSQSLDPAAAALVPELGSPGSPSILSSALELDDANHLAEAHDQKSNHELSISPSQSLCSTASNTSPSQSLCSTPNKITRLAGDTRTLAEVLLASDTEEEDDQNDVNEELLPETQFCWHSDSLVTDFHVGIELERACHHDQIKWTLCSSKIDVLDFVSRR